MDRHYVGKVSFVVKMKRLWWNVTACLFFKLFPTKLFRLWRIAILKLWGAKIEWDAEVYSSVRIWAPWNLQIGHRACLGPNVICYNQDLVVLEDDVVVSQYAYLCTASHDINKFNTASDSLITAPIILKEKAWIGSKAYIGLGVSVGQAAIVGATASVYKNVEDMCVVGGNPAKVLKYRKLK